MLKRFPEAIKFYRETIKLDEEHDKAIFGLAMIYLTQGKTSETNKQLEKLKQLNSPLADELLQNINLSKQY